MKKLTIAVPTFNGGKNLERAIRSCKNIQLSSEDYEILVIDNCSTDNSISNLNELKDQFGNLVLIKNQKNVGRIQNWNVDEIKMIEGLLFISMLPLHSDNLERQLALFCIGIERLNEIFGV